MTKKSILKIQKLSGNVHDKGDDEKLFKMPAF
jgi:hypothetical protein